ncbi:MAG TPA: hypothetical protein VMB34_15775 [Acetobacteraceae bacterium]|nr:hypothetical protein [Acetobacteraceae bacterium]
MVRNVIGGAAAAMLAMLAGCGPSYSPNTYDAAAVQQANKVTQGEVVGVRKVGVSADAALGTVTGAAAGGIAGSQVDSGGPITALSTLGGTVIGGLVGSGVQHAQGDTTAYEYIVRQTDGSLVSVTQRDKVPLALGQKVLVIAGRQARVVPDYTVWLPGLPPVAATKLPSGGAGHPAGAQSVTAGAATSPAASAIGAGAVPGPGSAALATTAPASAPSAPAPAAAAVSGAPPSASASAAVPGVAAPTRALPATAAVPDPTAAVPALTGGSPAAAAPVTAVTLTAPATPSPPAAPPPAASAASADTRTNEVTPAQMPALLSGGTQAASPPGAPVSLALPGTATVPPAPTGASPVNSAAPSGGAQPAGSLEGPTGSPATTDKP